jgi:hypothetical protein
MRGIDGKVMLAPRSGPKRGDQGAVVIVLPADKAPVKMVLDGLRPGDPGDAKSATLAKFGGVATRVSASGDFALSVPAAGSYRILVLSRRATSEPDRPPEPRDLAEIEKYFHSPADLLKRCRYQWLKMDLRAEAKPINVEFAE